MRAHLLDLAELVAEVLEGEAVAGERLAGELLGLALVELLFGALEQGGDVAHAHNAADDAVRVEGLKGVGLFAGAEELDGRAGDVADGERRAAAGVTVHLGEDGAGDGEQVVEGLGGLDGVLTGHGVGDEEDLGGVEQLFELRHLIHQGGVDLVAAGGVDDEHVAAEVGGLALGLAGEAEDLVGAGGGVGELALVDIGADRLGDDGELLAGGGAVDVDGDEHGAMAGLLEPLAELAAGGRLTGSLQAGHEDDAGRLGALLEARGVLAEEVDELVVDDLDDLLGGAEGGGDLGAHRLVADVLDEFVDDGEVHVGFEQGETDLTDGLGDVLVGDGALATEVLKGALELIGEILKHNWSTRKQVYQRDGVFRGMLARMVPVDGQSGVNRG